MKLPFTVELAKQKILQRQSLYAVNKSNKFVINLQQVCKCQVATSLILTDFLHVVYQTCQDLLSTHLLQIA